MPLDAEEPQVSALLGEHHKVGASAVAGMGRPSWVTQQVDVLGMVVGVQ